jgi:hypothetical protein
VKAKPPWSDPQALKDLAKKLGLNKPAFTSYAEKLGLKSSAPGSALNWFHQRHEREFEHLAFEEHRRRLEAEEARGNGETRKYSLAPMPTL